MSGRDYPTAGDSLYVSIKPKLDSGDKVVLDMSDVPFLPSMFLNVSIGRLIKETSVDYVKNNITFRNIRLSDAQRVRDYVERFRY